MKQEGATLQRRNGYGPQRTRMALPWGPQKASGCHSAVSDKPDELVNTSLWSWASRRKLTFTCSPPAGKRCQAGDMLNSTHPSQSNKSSVTFFAASNIICQILSTQGNSNRPQIPIGPFPASSSFTDPPKQSNF